MGFKYTLKFYWGIALVVLSLLIGKIAFLLFFAYIDSMVIRWLMAILYLASWPMLITGLWWIGKEYTESIRKYFGYRYYLHHLKRGTKKIYHHTQERTKRIKERLRGKKSVNG